MKGYLKRKIRNRLSNYRIPLNTPDQTLPFKTSASKKIAVIGGGIAGISAAANLAERGFAVTLFEKENFLGGKAGSWSFESNGETLRTEHGFHAFFRQYYNLRSFLKKIGAFENLIPIEDYLILLANGDKIGFRELDPTPGFNILSLRKQGIFNWSSFLNPASANLLQLLKFHPEKTYRRFDKMSFAAFASKTRMPHKMQLVFNTFARAFFSEPDKMSMAELMKGFHFYFLSNEDGLIYDVLNDDFQSSFIDHCERFIIKHGGDIQKGKPVDEIRRHPGGFNVRGNDFDYAVLCMDVQHIKPLIEKSASLKQYSGFYSSIKSLKQADRYAVYRLWADRFEANKKLPFFIFTDRLACLDSVTLYHKMERSSEKWSQKNNGGIFELHSYTLPDSLLTDEQIKNALLKEFYHYFPELQEMQIRHSYFQHRKDFPAFHTGLHVVRPTIKTEIQGLFLAGDWVKMDNATMLMEAAYTSGALAANEVLKAENLAENALESVPVHGLLS